MIFLSVNYLFENFSVGYFVASFIVFVYFDSRKWRRTQLIYTRFVIEWKTLDCNPVCQSSRCGNVDLSLMMTEVTQYRAAVEHYVCVCECLYSVKTNGTVLSLFDESALSVRPVSESAWFHQDAIRRRSSCKPGGRNTCKLQ